MPAIDLDSPEPLYQQVARRIREAIANGWLAAGDPLPPGREFAEDLAVSSHTVARAYRLLAREGLLRVRHGRGVVVIRDKVARADRRPTAASLARAVEAAVVEARQQGLRARDVRRAVERALARHPDVPR